ncbi:MAG: 4'-phosphopantetheinyl transferase superfamily protein [Lachnospiraceae bacterium]|nr:4'-phosphopantetheinyl transferase superfamily protein [Lachnospiraceae bacterium]
MKQTAEISVYFADLEPLLDPAFFEPAMRKASPERRDRANRFRFAEGRMRTLGGELLLRKALLDRGLGTRELNYGYGPQEKPYLIDLPDFHFNISHSGEYVMLAAADREVGCDIEKIARYDLRVAKRFFTPEEYECIAAAPPEEQKERFFRY